MSNVRNRKSEFFDLIGGHHHTSGGFPVARFVLSLLALISFTALPLAAQSFPTDDPVLKRLYSVGIDSSQVYELAQPLLDSIGPRLTGTPGISSGNDWLVARYRKWGVTARNEQYGTWSGWRRGITHVDLMSPRVRTLEATMLAWSARDRRQGRGDGRSSSPTSPIQRGIPRLAPASREVRARLVSAADLPARLQLARSSRRPSHVGHASRRPARAGREAWAAGCSATGATVGDALASALARRRCRAAW